MREIKTKADTDSPELTGIPTAPTPSDDTNTNQIANIEYITSKLGNTDSLPNQENHTNDLLTTDGTNPAWSDVIDIKTINSNSDVVKINTDGSYLYGWGQYVRDSGYITEQLMSYLVSEKNIYKKLIVDNNTTLGITNSNNLIISNETNQLTYNDKKVLVEGDVNLPITVDENGDYVLG